MNVIGLILGGGTGSRLRPLTVKRSKPAVPLAGKYRLVDVPISNCITSNINRIYLLTQYNSGSLHQHIQSTYQFDQFSRGFVQLLAAEQTPHSSDWFQGTADAVRQSMHHLASAKPDLVIILSGDQLFRMDFRELVAEHNRHSADITISAIPVPADEATDLGILRTDRVNRVSQFTEKPRQEELGDGLKFCGRTDCYLASMGIYAFNFDTLQDLLLENSGQDFGKDIIPAAISDHRVFSYVFDGYWKDIGTIRAFWRANIDLTSMDPPFSFSDGNSSIYTRPRFLPPSRIRNCRFGECLLSEGVMIEGTELHRSVIGLRSQIKEGSKITNTVIMGNDYFAADRPDMPYGIGKNCIIENAIIDKNVSIGDNVSMSPAGLEDMVSDLYWVKDNILVIPKDIHIPANTVIGDPTA